MKNFKYITLVYIIILNSFISITNTIYPRVLPLGKLVGALLLLNIAFIYLDTLRNRDLFLILFLGVVCIMAFSKSKEHAITVEHLMFFLSTVLIMWKISESSIQDGIYYALNKNRKVLSRYVIISMIILIGGLFIPSSYRYVNGGNLYYGFAESGHKLAANICFITAIYIFLQEEKKVRIYQVGCVIILFMIILMTGSRTYCIPEFILLFVYYKTKLNKIRGKWILTPIILLVVIYLVINSNVLERFFAMGNNQYVSSNFWEAASSGRLIWWKIDINAFLDLNFIGKLFGQGFSYVYEINEQYYGLRISAHNDFITLLLSIGLFGCIGYITVIIRLLYEVYKRIQVKGRKDTKIKILIISLYILWNANISGFYGSQQYVFSLIMIIIIIITSTSKNKA